MLELGPELFDLLNARQQVGSRLPVIYGDGGLSVADIRRIESELGFPLPDDFAFLLRNIRDPGSILLPWASFDKRTYDDLIAWVRQGIESSIEEDGFWDARWGQRPDGLTQAFGVFRTRFATWPKLLPLHAHRFLAAEPCRSNNPVFSIMGTDIIGYGANLAHYLLLEFVDRTPDAYGRHTSDHEVRSIDVWSELAS
jgi:hypothetical protein